MVVGLMHVQKFRDVESLTPALFLHEQVKVVSVMVQPVHVDA